MWKVKLALMTFCADTNRCDTCHSVSFFLMRCESCKFSHIRVQRVIFSVCVWAQTVVFVH